MTVIRKRPIASHKSLSPDVAMEEVPLAGSLGDRVSESNGKRAWATLRKVFRRYYWLHHRILEKDLKEASAYAFGRLLDIGCGSMPYIDIFEPRVSECSGVDNWVATRVHDRIPPRSGFAYGNALQMPFKSASFDTVLCTQTIEHTPEPWEVFAQISRVIKPEGIFILSAPQTWQVHGAPHDYYRFTKYSLEYLAKKNGFEVIYIRPQGGTWATIGQTFSNYIDFNLHHPLARVFVMPLRLLSDIVFFFLDSVARADRRNGLLNKTDTLNYIMVARKADAGKNCEEPAAANLIRDTSAYREEGKRLLDVLACPLCAGNLLIQGTHIECLQCNREYAVYEGVPLMVSENEANTVINDPFYLTNHSLDGRLAGNNKAKQNPQGQTSKTGGANDQHR